MSQPLAPESSLLGTCPSQMPQKSAKVNAEAAVRALSMVRSNPGADLEVVECSQQRSAQLSQRLCVLPGAAFSSCSDAFEPLLCQVQKGILGTAERARFALSFTTSSSFVTSCSFGKVSWRCVPRVLVTILLSYANGSSCLAENSWSPFLLRRPV